MPDTGAVNLAPISGWNKVSGAENKLG